MTRVLSVTSECAPLIKTGGLADVAGALPAALAQEGWEMRTLLPGYPAVLDQVKLGKKILAEPDLFGRPAEVWSAKGAGLDLFILRAPHLFERAGTPYLDPHGADWPDNPERFAALSWVAASIARNGAGKWAPKVMHCHDWQAGLAPVYLEEGGTGGPGSIFTVHNIAFHGLAPAAKRARLRLPAKGFSQAGFEYWNQISALKAGLVWSDKLTTVSPTYARELLRPEFGMGLDGVLKGRSEDLTGILNGIDEIAWNPETDPAIQTYKTPRGKARAKKALRKEFDLPDAKGPLCVVVSRLSDQKGLDLLLDALPVLIDRGGQLALLGSGDKALEARWRQAAAHPAVSVHVGYDEAKSHRMIAGADAILVPSRFEPCGLTQLYGLRYGTVPVVAYTGGLVDTVIHANPMALNDGVATGIQFHPITTDGLAQALFQLLDLYADQKAWKRIQTNAMAQNVGWGRSAKAYAALYDQVARTG